MSTAMVFPKRLGLVEQIYCCREFIFLFVNAINSLLSTYISELKHFENAVLVGFTKLPISSALSNLFSVITIFNNTKSTRLLIEIV